MYKFIITLRYIRRRLITLFSIIGVAFGVMVLIVVLSVMDGFRKEFTSSLQGTLSDIVITVRTNRESYKSLEQKILAVENVKACSPHINGLGLIGAGVNYAGSIIIGIDYDKEREIGKLEEYLVTAYKEQKIWAEEVLDKNVKGPYQCLFSWKVLNVSKVRIQNYTHSATRVLCAEIQEFIPSDKTLPKDNKIKFHAFTIQNNKVILMENDLDEEAVSSALFRVGDFNYSFVEHLQEPKNELARYLVSNLSSYTQKIISADIFYPMDLNQDLNRILATEQVYSPSRFENIELSAETKQLLEQKPKGLDLIRLNRLLLEDAYSHDIIHYKLLRNKHIDFEELIEELQNEDMPLSKYLREESSYVTKKKWEKYLKSKEAYANNPSDDQLRKEEETDRRSLRAILWEEVKKWVSGEAYLFSVDTKHLSSFQQGKIPSEIRDYFAEKEIKLSETATVEKWKKTNRFFVQDKVNNRYFWIVESGKILHIYSQKKASLYTPERFQGVELSSATKEMLEKNSQERTDIVFLNCYLLQDAYPSIIQLHQNFSQVSALAKQEFPAWEKYFETMAHWLNHRRLVEYLDHFSPNLHYIAVKNSHLFVLDSKKKKELDNANLSAEIKQKFMENKQALSSSASLEIIQAGKTWRILDPENDREFMVAEDLKVYGQSLLFSLKLNQGETYYQQLDEQILPVEITQGFSQHALPLPKNTSIEVKTKSEKWILRDQEFDILYKVIFSLEKNCIQIFVLPQIFPQDQEYFLGESRSLNKNKPYENIASKEERQNEEIRPLLMGYELMKDLGLQRGSVISLMTGKRVKEQGELQESLKAVSKKFVIAGGFKSGWQEIDKQLVYTRIQDLPDFLDVYKDPNAPEELYATEVCVVLHDFKLADQTKKLLDATLNKNVAHESLKIFKVERWEDRRKTLLSAIRLERNVMAFILFFIVILAVVTIMIILILMVTEKTKDIGILKSMGATGSGIMAIFILNGLCISVFGSILGTICGVEISLNVNWLSDQLYEFTGYRVFPRDVYYLDHIPAEVSFGNIAMIVGNTLLLSFIDCMLPALKAAKMDVVEALNAESPSFQWKFWKNWKRWKEDWAKFFLGPNPAPIELRESFFGVHHLCRNYEVGRSTLHVLNDVCIEIKKGEIFVIVGTSGAGKSTLLHLMGLLDTPSDGMIFLNGINLNTYSYRKQAEIRSKKIGFIFQFYHLLPEFTALENVLMGAMVRYGFWEWPLVKSKCTEKAKELLRRVGLASRMDHLPQELSGGERQRVAIARALINQPEIILCDEPTGNLDEENSQSIYQLILELNQQLQQTFIIVTHDENIADKGHRVFKLTRGQLGQIQ